MSRDQESSGTPPSPPDIAEIADWLTAGRREGLIKGLAIALPLSALVYIAVVEALIWLPFG